LFAFCDSLLPRMAYTTPRYKRKRGAEHQSDSSKTPPLFKHCDDVYRFVNVSCPVKSQSPANIRQLWYSHHWWVCVQLMSLFLKWHF